MTLFTLCTASRGLGDLQCPVEDGLQGFELVCGEFDLLALVRHGFDDVFHFRSFSQVLSLQRPINPDMSPFTSLVHDLLRITRQLRTNGHFGSNRHDCTCSHLSLVSAFVMACHHLSGDVRCMRTSSHTSRYVPFCAPFLGHVRI